MLTERVYPCFFLTDVYNCSKTCVSTLLSRLRDIIVSWRGYISVKYACVSNPCENGGVCQNVPHGFRCQCQPGWTGSTCAISKWERGSSETFASLAFAVFCAPWRPPAHGRDAKLRATIRAMVTAAMSRRIFAWGFAIVVCDKCIDRLLCFAVQTPLSWQTW